ncbi:MAG TPA: SWIM zinc finger family protein [Gemmataceae bacterium]|nr:SWIM zinc finger family protein [Gemmataceae bacterium]
MVGTDLPAFPLIVKGKCNGYFRPQAQQRQARVRQLPADPDHQPHRLRCHLAAAPSRGRGKAVRLRKADGTAYDVAVTERGHECSCPDWIFNRDGKDRKGCKHVAALRACRLL